MRIYNEVRCWDASAQRDGYYGSSYIELYNADEEDISLDGWYVSNDPTNLKKSRLSDMTIGSKEVVLVYANGKADSGDSLNFKLSPEGEKIFLSDETGNLVDKVYVPKQDFGTVYARVIDGASQWCIQTETADYSNNNAEMLPERSLNNPKFSHESGFYEEAFVLKIEAGPGEKIYYTLDGSRPTDESSEYKEGILVENRSTSPNVINSVRNIRADWLTYGPDETPVDKAVIVRAIAMDSSNHVSEIVTKSYFIGLEKYRNHNVLSIITEYDDLFGDEGIFVTGKDYDEVYLSGENDGSVIPNIFKSGRRWEVMEELEIFESGKEVSDQEVGLRVKGASSRSGKKKRIGIYAREEYSESQYVEGFSVDGREAHSYITYTDSTNAALQDLIKDRDVSVQSGILVDIFINGEYYYTGTMLEKYDKYYLQDSYHVDADNVMMIKDEETMEGPEQSRDSYETVLEFVKNNDLSVQENYDLLLEQIDMQSYIDYICANVYFCNMDVSDIKNYMLWRTVEKEDVDFGDMRWRWMIYDVDCLIWTHPEAYGVEYKSQINSFSQIMEYTGCALNKHPIFLSAKENDEFCKQFVLTFMDMANVNFAVEHVENVLKKWDMTLDEYDGFFRDRFDYIIPYMAEEFELSGTLESVTLKVNDSNSGIIRLNTTTPDLSEGSWKGKYYTDYPITVTAIPEEGYEFAGWCGSVTSDSATIEAEVLEGITLEAVFERAVE